MQELLSLYSPEEINAAIKMVTSLGILVLATSLGTFTKELLFPKMNTFRQNIGLVLVSGFVALWVVVRYEDVMSVESVFLMCVALGFFVPGFKDWLKGNKIFKILFSIANKTSDVASTAIEEIHKELEKEEKEE